MRTGAAAPIVTSCARRAGLPMRSTLVWPSAQVTRASSDGATDPGARWMYATRKYGSPTLPGFVIGTGCVGGGAGAQAGWHWTSNSGMPSTATDLNLTMTPSPATEGR